MNRCIHGLNYCWRLSFVLGVAIVLGGCVSWLNGGSITQGTPTQPEATSTEAIDTSDWQTYRNEEHGFEFKYPREWILEKNQETINIYNQDWDQVKEPFRSYKSPVLWVTFKDVEPAANPKVMALKALDLTRYASIDDALGIDTGIWKYNFATMQGTDILYVTRGEETTINQYLIPLVKKPSKVAIMNILFGNSFQEEILKTVKFYSHATSAQPVRIPDSQIRTIPLLPLPLNFIIPKINCADFKTSPYRSSQTSVAIYSEYCLQEFGTKIIPEKAFSSSLVKSNIDSLPPIEGPMYRDSEEATRILDQYRRLKLDVQSVYEFSIYLQDELGSDLLGQWYIVQVENTSLYDVSRWYFCEAGCPWRVSKFSNEFIIFNKIINPSSGAGDMCISIEGTAIYVGMKQIKCELRALIEELRDYKFRM